MNGSLPYAIAAIASLAGWFCFAALLYRVLFVVLSPAGVAKQAATKTLPGLAGITGLLLVVGLAVPKEAGKAPGFTQEAFAKLPITWPIMPFAAWAALILLIIGVVRLFVAIGRKELGERHMRTTVIVLAAAALFGLLHKSTNDEITLVSGVVPMSANFLIGTLVLLLAAFVAMIVAGRAAKIRGIASIVRSHVLLLIGSVIFGVPFLWALITSFKEDRDMSSPDGLVWIPKVEQTTPYRDPDRPLYQLQFEGYTAKADLIEKRDNMLVLDIQRPLVLRGRTAKVDPKDATEIDRDGKLVSGKYQGQSIKGFVFKELEDGKRRVRILEPAQFKDKEYVVAPAEVEPIRNPGLRTANYPEALEYLPPESNSGLVYFKNTLILVFFSVIGTLFSSSLVAYAFARLKFPSKGILYSAMLATMMLPGAVTLMPRFLIFKNLHWIDTLYPIWVPAFLGSAFNIFMLREFFSTLPLELEDASKIDGCSYLQTFWRVMLPQVKPALAVITIWTFMGVWNNFMEPLIYINSPERMPVAYALQLYNGDRFGEPGLLMAFSILCMMPVLALFFFAQRYFIEGVSLSGLGGR